MAIQMPMFLVNRTGPEWDKFVEQARKANMSLGQMEAARVQALRQFVAANGQQAQQFGAQWARNRLAIDQTTKSALNLSQVIYNLNALNITPYGYERFAYRLSLMLQNLGKAGPIVAAGAAAIGAGFVTAAAGVTIFDKSLHAAASAGDADAKRLINSYETLRYEIAKSGEASFAAFGSGMLKPFIRDLAEATETMRVMNERKFEIIGSLRNPLSFAAGTAFGPLGGEMARRFLPTETEGKKADEEVKREMRLAREERRREMSKATDTAVSDDARMGRTSRRYGRVVSRDELARERKALEDERKALADDPWRDVALRDRPTSDPDKSKEDERRERNLAEYRAKRKLLDDREAELDRLEREHAKRRNEFQAEMGGRKDDARRVETMKEINRLIKEEDESFERKRKTSGATAEEEEAHWLKMNEYMERRRHFQSENLAAEQKEKAIRNEIGGGRQQAKQLENVRDIDQAIKTELSEINQLKQDELLTDEEREKREQRINDYLSQRRKIEQELLGLEDRRKEMAKTRKAEINDIHTIKQAEERRVSVMRELEELKKQGLDRSRQAVRLGNELLDIEQRKLAIVREIAQQQIAAARAEFQATIARRAQMFGQQGGLIQGLRAGADQGEVMKQLARDRAQRQLGDPAERIAAEKERRAQVARNAAKAAQDAHRNQLSFLEEERPDPSTPEGKEWKRDFERMEGERKRREAVADRAKRESDDFDNPAAQGMFLRQQEDAEYRRQLGGLRRGKINSRARGRNNLTDREVQIARNREARRRLQQGIAAGTVDPVNAQAMSDALEEEGRTLEEGADVGDAARNMGRGGPPGARNRQQQIALNRQNRMQNRGQQVPDKVNNMPQLMQQAAQQQAAAFNAQNGFNQAMAQGLQQAQQVALQAQQQTEQLAEMVRQDVQNFNRRRGAAGPGAF